MRPKIRPVTSKSPFRSNSERVGPGHAEPYNQPEPSKNPSPLAMPSHTADTADTLRMIPSLLPAADRKTPSRWLWPLLVLILCLGSIGNVQAGCSGSDVEPTRWADSKAPGAGQLTLALYVRYEHGKLSFTLERPIQPCHGPSCRTKSTMEPTILPLGGSRIVLAQADISRLQWDPLDPSQAKLARNFSQYAPRGGLDVQEPPPRATL